MTPTKINLREKLGAIDQYWSPRVAAELNGQHVRLAKLNGTFDWHHHDKEDELFLVLEGTLRIEFRDGAVELGEGEMVVVPRGLEHRPVAEDDVHVLLFEPAATLNTGNITNERTIAKPESI